MAGAIPATERVELAACADVFGAASPEVADRLGLAASSVGGDLRLLLPGAAGG